MRYALLAFACTASVAAAGQGPDDREAVAEIVRIGGSTYENEMLGQRITRIDFFLSNLDLSDDDLVGAADAFKKLTLLQASNLANTRITGRGLAALTGTGLEELVLDGTPMTDAGLANVRRLKKLRRLSLKVTRVTDAGLTNLQDIETLREVELALTEVTPNGVAALRKALPKATITYSDSADSPELHGLCGTWSAAPAVDRSHASEGAQRFGLKAAGHDLALLYEGRLYLLFRADAVPASEPKAVLLMADIHNQYCIVNTRTNRCMAIYRRDGDTLTFCWGGFDGRVVSPARFSPLEGELVVFKREPKPRKRGDMEPAAPPHELPPGQRGS
jgi:hypothetical protein